MRDIKSPRLFVLKFCATFKIPATFTTENFPKHCAISRLLKPAFSTNKVVASRSENLHLILKEYQHHFYAIKFRRTLVNSPRQSYFQQQENHLWQRKITKLYYRKMSILFLDQFSTSSDFLEAVCLYLHLWDKIVQNFKKPKHTSLWTQF